MARARKKSGSARSRFGKVARAANAVCHRETNSVAGFKKCMSREMKSGLKAEGFKVRR